MNQYAVQIAVTVVVTIRVEGDNLQQAEENAKRLVADEINDFIDDPEAWDAIEVEGSVIKSDVLWGTTEEKLS